MRDHGPHTPSPGFLAQSLLSKKRRQGQGMGWGRGSFYGLMWDGTEMRRTLWAERKYPREKNHLYLPDSMGGPHSTRDS